MFQGGAAEVTTTRPKIAHQIMLCRTSPWTDTPKLHKDCWEISTEPCRRNFHATAHATCEVGRACQTARDDVGHHHQTRASRQRADAHPSQSHQAPRDAGRCVLRPFGPAWVAEVHAWLRRNGARNARPPKYAPCAIRRLRAEAHTWLGRNGAGNPHPLALSHIDPMPKLKWPIASPQKVVYPPRQDRGCPKSGGNQRNVRRPPRSPKLVEHRSGPIRHTSYSSRDTTTSTSPSHTWYSKKYDKRRSNRVVARSLRVAALLRMCQVELV